MKILEQKHLTLLDEARRRGLNQTGNMRACFEVLAVAAAIDRACAVRLAPYRLSEGKFVLLFLLEGHRDGLSAHELAERAGVTRATITGLLDGLERDGLVSRHAHAEDRRKITVRLTDSGQAVARGLFDEHALWIASLFAGFSADERRTLSGFLQRIWENAEGNGEEAPSPGPDARA